MRTKMDVYLSCETCETQHFQARGFHDRLGSNEGHRVLQDQNQQCTGLGYTSTPNFSYTPLAIS